MTELDEGYQIYERTNQTYKLVYDQSVILPVIETWMDPFIWTKWWQQYWSLTIYASTIYLLSALLGQKLMIHRQPIQCDRVLMLWNSVLAVFSAFGAIRCGEEVIQSLVLHGFEATICNSCDPHGVCAQWHWYFAMSKLIELGDTVFIVIRKKPLQLLHWYHHITVLVYTWHSATEHVGAGRWFIWLNYTVHAFMYTYYAMRAAACKVPKLVAVAVTLMQITQMVLGVYITMSVYQIKQRDTMPCQQSYRNLYFAMSIYASYFVLFLKFFVDAYILNRKKKKTE